MTHSPLQQLIIERIQRAGPLTFAEYMRMALYEPGYGYYISNSAGIAKMGWQGADYFTSTDVSALFANCMGRQLYRMWEQLKRPTPFLALEQGAGRGDLARGVRAWAEKEAPDFHTALDYRVEDIHSGEDAIGLEGSLPTRLRLRVLRQLANETTSLPTVRQAARQYLRSGKLQGSNRAPTGRAQGEEAAPGAAVPAVILSNELIDAFPVHVVEMRAGNLYEIYVDTQDGRLFEVLETPSSAAVAEYLDGYSIPWRSFADGWRAEINLDAPRWMERAASLISRRGFILTIDYGDKAKALYTRTRPRGTLLCYSQHQVNERPLVHPGEQDITAHVNFSALIDEGRRHGLRLHTFTSQRRWLENMGIFDELERRRTQEYAASVTHRASDAGQVALLQWYTLRQGVAALTDPGGMGNFKVLIMRHA